MRKTFASRWLAALLTLALICSLVPASFADDPAPTPDPAPVPTVTLNPSKVLIPAGGTAELTASISNGEADAKITRWVSSSTQITVAADATDANKALVTVPDDAGIGDKATITAIYTVTDANSGSTTDYRANCDVTVGSLSNDANVIALDVALYTDADCKTELTEALQMKVKEYKTVYAKVEPTWDDGAEGTEDHSLLKQKLTWSVEGGGGVVSISTGASKGNVYPIVVNARTNGETKIKVTATYDNPKNGKQVTSDPPVECDIKVGDAYEVVITEYHVKTREVTLIKGGSSKTLQAYIVENGQWKEDDNITWTLEKTGVVRITPGKDKDRDKVVVEVESGAKDGDKVKLTATYNDGSTTPPSSTVTCIVKTESSSGDGPGGEDPDDPPASDKLPDGVTVQVKIEAPSAESNGVYVTDPGSENIKLNVTFTDKTSTRDATFEWSTKDGGFAVYNDGSKRYLTHISWKSSDDTIAKVNTVVSGGSGRYVLAADQPGKATLTVSVAGKTDSLTVEVKGFKLKESELKLYENDSIELKEVVVPYGGADPNGLTCWSDNSTIAAYAGGRIEAYKPGTTTFTVSDPKRGFRANFKVIVEADPNATIDYGTLHAQTQKFLSFSDLLSRFRRQAGGKLSHITGINLASSGGDIYYKYNATTGSGTGVGAENYYHPYRSGGIPYGQRSLEDLTFVPKKGYAGQVTINYTGVSEDGKNYVCQLLITVDPESGSDAGISLTTPYNTALRLNGDDFNRVCRERLGVKLDHVIFSQPPERQGTLYTNYVGPGNYGKVVSPNTRYSLKELDDIWFVPAPGFSGTVTLYYTAYGTGTNAGSFAGQATIAVKPEDGVAISGLTFDIVRGGVAYFDDERFNTYCRQVLQEDSWSNRQTLSRIRFDALPSASEGVLYYEYRSSSNTGARAEAGTSYYYGTRTPRIDRLAFVPAADFIGTVKLPFTGWTVDGTRFTGNVEVNVRGGTGYGDILYVCSPGKSVSFRSSDFANLSRELTGRTISYIVFRGLPSTVDGSVYYNNTRISTTGSQYQNSSISRLSFRASNSFSGAVDIPFEGRSTSGETFNGVITISTSSSGGSSSSGSSSSWGNIRYTSSGGEAAVFDRYDFDSLSQWDVGENVSSVRFQVPSTSQGSLYRNYRSSSDTGSRVTSSSTSISRSSLDQVAFIPASGYTGTVYIDFTAISSGGSTFDGTVEIAVERGSWDVPTTPVRFYDVPSNAYYADAVSWAVSSGITSGTSSTTFSPNQTCTIAQILSFLYRANGSPRVTGSNPFTDVRTSDYYYEAALWAHQKGLVSGSSLHPFSPCTRSMVVTYLWKLAGQPSPSARPLSYAPYTVSGSSDLWDDGPKGSKNYTVRFDAAVTAKTKLTVHYDDDSGYGITRDNMPPETYDVMVIAVRPGSSYTIDGGFYSYIDYYGESDGGSEEWFNGVPGMSYFRASDGTFRFTQTGMSHGGIEEGALFKNSLSWFRGNGNEEIYWGNNYSKDCGVLIRLNGNYYFVTYADSAIAAGLISGSAGFSDVSANASYAQAVAWATEQKITSGTSKTTFSPDKTCTRGQIVSFLYRAMGW